MKVVEQEIHSLENSISKMWALIHQQLCNTGEAMLTGDEELVYKIVSWEHRVSTFELKTNSDCEGIIALYVPATIDLRFVLAMYKINTNLERLGDFAGNIARFVGSLPEREPINPQLVKETRVEGMLSELLSMISLTKKALEKESSEIASRISLEDSLIDEINHNSTAIIAKYIEEHKDSALTGLYMTGVIRKVGRFGDRCTNIVEELIFYLDAKVIKHMDKTE